MRPERELPLRHAVALGLLQGPTELLPVSSSSHTALVPWLCGWSYPELDPELRKTFEVALHAGAGLALALDMRAELIAAALSPSRRHLATVALSLAPPALSGYVFERFIERRLGGPRSIAAGLIVGAAAMALADARPGTGPAGADRRQVDAGPRDGLALGLAQAAALIPGVSRNGATLAVARARGFTRGDAQALSWHAGLPVILGASALKAWRLRQGNVPDGAAWSATLAAGGASAFVSTLTSAKRLRRSRVSERPLLPWAVYRCAIAAVTLRRLRCAQNKNG